MKQRLAKMFVVSLLLTCAGFLYAGDFWNSKDVSQWSEKELLRVVTDSAWAQQAMVTFKGSQPSVLWNARGETALCEIQEQANATRYAARSQLNSASTTVLVRWESALPVKLALLRLGFLGDSPAPEKVSGFLAPDPDNYVVSVSGLPPGVVEAPAGELAPLATLRRKSQDPIYAELSEALNAGDSAVLRFSFPRRPALQLADKQVEFVLELPEGKIKKKFDLRKMGFGEDALAL